ncbi:MAG: hypothetical protein KDD70_04820 [Bdellovibrionales bacterium]|nr:hypothetical protein [Bdellovibrionales bacterium]
MSEANSYVPVTISSERSPQILKFPGQQFNAGVRNTPPPVNDTISLLDVMRIVRRNLFLGAVLVPLFGVSFFLFAKSITPSYKSPAVIQIQSSYFRAPLVNDMLPEEHDRGELMSRRAALIQLALSDDFLMSLYERFPELYGEVGFTEPEKELQALHAKDDRAKALALFALRERIESFSLGGSTQQLSAVASRPELAQQLSTVLVERILKTLREEREGLLLNAREAIARHVRQLAGELNAIEQSIKNTDERGLSQELARVKADLEALLVHYTERHPKVFQLKQQSKSLENRLKALQAASLSSDENDIPRSAAAKEPTQDVYNELLKKLSYLQIAFSLEQEESGQYVQVIESPSYPLVPFFPNKKLFTLLGLIIGGVLWIVWATIREISQFYPSQSTAESLAGDSNLLFLGKLPERTEEILLSLDDGNTGPLLPGSSAIAL